MLNFKSQSQKLWPVGRGHRRRRRTTLKNASLCEITSLCKKCLPMRNHIPMSS